MALDLDPAQLQEIVQEVLARLGNGGHGRPGKALPGVYDEMEVAIERAAAGQKKLVKLNLEERERLIAAIRQTLRQHAEELAQLAVADTGMGRVEDKILKHHLVADKTPGTEDLITEAWSGDKGLTLVEMSPFGVIGAITPSTNPVATIFCNVIGMIAGGNSVVFSPHPGARKCSLRAVELINEAILAAGGPEDIVVAISEPALEKTQVMFQHPAIDLLVATGGPGLVRAVLKSGKKAIGAGAGNPPVVVDETADIEKAGHDIMAGSTFDNNIPCIAEKEIIAVESVADYLLFNLLKNGGYHVKRREDIDTLANKVLDNKGKPKREFIGRDAAVIAREALGLELPPDKGCLIVEVEREHPFVREEMMMPILPLVRVKDIEEAIAVAMAVEQGNRHTAIIHSKNVDNMTQMARAIQTTIFVKNGPSYAGIGVGGEGFTTFTIAGPTGEGLTSARTFTRRRRCVLIDALSIR